MSISRLSRFVALASLFFASTALSAQEHPDFDLAASCRSFVGAEPGERVEVESTIVLTTRSNPSESGVQGWSLSLASTGAATIVRATTDGTAGAATSSGGLRDNGFERIEITSGAGNAGAVCALVLSFTRPVTLPVSGDSELFKLSLEVTVPAEGCVEAGLAFQDGLQGAGQPVQNTLTWMGASRADDGGVRIGDLGPFDNDDDGPVHCVVQVCAGVGQVFTRGNCDSAGGINLTDAIFALNHLFLGGEAPRCRKACDTDDNGSLNLTDPIALLIHLFQSGPGPAAPYPDCGVDSTADDLDCAPQPTCL